jgi:serine/threonine-protein kinase
MSQPPTTLAPGTLVGDRYTIESELGRGGMGTVYAAVHALTHRRVALKVLAWAEPDQRGDRQQRFFSEARNAVAVRHRHIVDVLDMGMHGAEPFLVMEHLDGEALDAHLHQYGAVPLQTALAWLLPIMGALAVLHDRGIIHRDIKPSNIFLTRAGTSVIPTLLDFGLSRAHADERLTRAGTVLGTPLYMAPEHACGGQTTAQSDVWSMGVVLFEVLSGVPPYIGSEPHALATQVLAGHVRDLRSVLPNIHPRIAAAVAGALVRDRAGRHPTMRALAQALVEAAVVAGVGLPEAPDPVGLPAYDTWLRGALSAGHGSRPSWKDLQTAPLPQAESPDSLSSWAPLEGDTPTQARATAVGPTRRFRRTIRWVSLAAAGLVGAGLLATGRIAQPSTQSQAAAAATEAQGTTPAPSVASVPSPTVSAEPPSAAAPSMPPDAARPLADPALAKPAAATHSAPPKARRKRQSQVGAQRGAAAPNADDIETEWR